MATRFSAASEPRHLLRKAQACVDLSYELGRLDAWDRSGVILENTKFPGTHPALEAFPLHKRDRVQIRNCRVGAQDQAFKELAESIKDSMDAWTTEIRGCAETLAQKRSR